MGTTSQNHQFLRWWKLYLVNAGGTTLLDVSQQRISFEVRASDVETPNTLRARIYNLSRDTVGGIFTQVSASVTGSDGILQNGMKVHLEAGYQNISNKGTVFDGDIVQARVGAEDAKDTFLDIFAADGDTAYSSFISQSRPAGGNDVQQMLDIAAAMNVPQADTNAGYLVGGTLASPRGKVMFGMSRAYAREVADRNNCRWSIQNGVLTLIPNTGYLPGTAVKINAQTGMIGVPEQTQEGVFVKCYLNPLIKIGGLIELNSADIIQSARSGPIGFSSRTEQQYNATVTNGAGLYRVMVAEHVGDTRGDSWFTELTCLAVDPSTAPNASVQE